MQKVKLAAALACALFLSACDQTLYSNLSESDANEMLVTLLKRGVDAKKSAQGDVFSIVVPEEQLVRSLEIIGEHSLPREQFQSLGTVFSGQGMIASQTEEQARLAFAISQELSATFSRIDGVLDARVHVVLVQHEQASGLTTPPSAAIFIRHTKDSPVENMLAEIKDIAAKAVPGLTYDRVTVMTELFTEKVKAPVLPVRHWYDNPAMAAAAVAALFLLLCAGGIIAARKLGWRLTKGESAEPKPRR
ncbi:MAG: type III secretion inner membrane ring lipoprotein SctJ [Proteobacteria bacterium]|uniref:Lipoprotein n=1 Tax=Candidatus Avisuccinivibrio stercorigallinarum TaxID=2840704 RepID=A0A9D9GTJ0_9GAMM|nr:type III secretion inner membrane ring lipoprotein SctJ [Candidatus Avisuccinivibrio stercorigallinarum]